MMKNAYLDKLCVGCTIWDWQHVNGEAASYEILAIAEYNVKCADDEGHIRYFPIILDEFNNAYIWAYLSRKDAEDDNV